MQERFRNLPPKPSPLLKDQLSLEQDHAPSTYAYCMPILMAGIRRRKCGLGKALDLFLIEAELPALVIPAFCTTFRRARVFLHQWGAAKASVVKITLGHVEQF